jgi:hypothetical protein
MNCTNCKNFHKSSSITTTETNVVVVFNDNPTDIVNEQKFCFAICQEVPSAGNALAVQLTVNGTPVSLLDKYGNPVPGCGLTKGCTYRGYYGTGGTAHVISNSLPRCGVIKSYAYEIETT